MSSSADKFNAVPTFVFGSRDTWRKGLDGKLGSYVMRSIQAECTLNAGGKFKDEFEYIVSKPAEVRVAGPHRPRPATLPPSLVHAPHYQERGAFERGHNGMRLVDFQRKLRARWDAERASGAPLSDFDMTLCEVAVRACPRGAVDENTPLRCHLRAPECRWSGCTRGTSSSRGTTRCAASTRTTCRTAIRSQA